MNSAQCKQSILAGLVAAAALMVAPGVVHAKDAGSQTFQVRARVPVSCWVRPDRDIVAGEGVSGSVIEACNNPGGYTITANYRQLGDGERAQMVYNNRPVELAKSGGQVLRRSNMATIKTVSYRFQNVTLEQPLTVFLTIQPI
ncbi:MULTISPECIES: hypothetical protein [unclassified Brevundimonas]|uniref:hypothetical protein n=1 Tax=unclassified Brevundimonas TaxID=2622653 RepID=UPI0025C5FBE5|nr:MULTISPECIES: hypothetical protein [unclassified Brevundimonas]